MYHSCFNRELRNLPIALPTQKIQKLSGDLFQFWCPARCYTKLQHLIPPVIFLTVLHHPFISPSSMFHSGLNGCCQESPWKKPYSRKKKKTPVQTQTNIGLSLTQFSHFFCRSTLAPLRQRRKCIEKQPKFSPQRSAGCHLHGATGVLGPPWRKVTCNGIVSKTNKDRAT